MLYFSYDCNGCLYLRCCFTNRILAQVLCSPNSFTSNVTAVPCYRLQVKTRLETDFPLLPLARCQLANTVPMATAGMCCSSSPGSRRIRFLRSVCSEAQRFNSLLECKECVLTTLLWALPCFPSPHLHCALSHSAMLLLWQTAVREMEWKSSDIEHIISVI